MSYILWDLMVPADYTMFVISERYKDGSTTLSSSAEKRIQSACNKDLHKDHRGMGFQSVKCFKCSKLGHIAKDCPEKRQNKPTRRIVLSEKQMGHRTRGF